MSKTAFRVGVVAGAQFVVLTIAAMFAFPGGLIVDPKAERYSFFRAFFSELGMTLTAGGRPNLPSAVLFVIALTAAGLGLIVFYAASLRLFRRPGPVRVLSLTGSMFAFVAGASFVGVAWTPVDLVPTLHYLFVNVAFVAFLPAVLAYMAAVLAHPRYPTRYALVYAAFGLMLAAYVWLLLAGPGLDTEAGIVVQATGQKLVVYLAIACMSVQSWGALRLINTVENLNT